VRRINARAQAATFVTFRHRFAIPLEIPIACSLVVGKIYRSLRASGRGVFSGLINGLLSVIERALSVSLAHRRRGHLAKGKVEEAERLAVALRIIAGSHLHPVNHAVRKFALPRFLVRVERPNYSPMKSDPPRPAVVISKLY